ncbi:MAG: aminotransferase class I/II-fold pyridoxal phosphate-dependent enzyme, partial [Deltaproteobacteria bacterium]
MTHFFALLEERLTDLRAAGADLIRLDVGSPDLPPPPHVIETLQRAAARPDAHGYQAHNATPALREAWAAHYQRHYGVHLNPQREILPLLGSKEGIFHLSLALLRPGDVVLAPDPGYVTYRRGAQRAGAQIHSLPLRPENGYLPDLEAIPAEILRRARLLWLNYPHNPTGATAQRAFFERVIAFARRHDLTVCHDAAYSLVTFDEYRAPSILEIPGALEIAVECNSLSKSHNMAGWRTGVLAGNAETVQALYRLKTQADSGHFLPILEAATAALEHTPPQWIAQRNREYALRRDTALEGLAALGLHPASPKGGMYVWSPLPPGWQSAEAFATECLTRAHVSLTPGTVFGPRGEGYFRLALTVPAPRLREALER